MNGNAWMSLLLVALALILPIAALRDRRLPHGKLLKLGIVWLAIFSGLAIAIGLAGGLSFFLNDWIFPRFRSLKDMI